MADREVEYTLLSVTPTLEFFGVYSELQRIGDEEEYRAVARQLDGVGVALKHAGNRPDDRAAHVIVGLIIVNGRWHIADEDEDYMGMTRYFEDVSGRGWQKQAERHLIDEDDET